MGAKVGEAESLYRECLGARKIIRWLFLTGKFMSAKLYELEIWYRERWWRRKFMGAKVCEREWL